MPFPYLFGSLSVRHCIAAAAGLLLACAMAHAEPLELRLFQRGYIQGGTTANTTLTDAAVAAFEAQNPGIDVQIVGVPWSREGDLKLRTALLARKRIDCFRVTHDELPAYVPRGGRLLSPVTPQLSAEDRADFGEGALAAVTHDGEVMAWPLWSSAMVLIANRGLIAQAGLDPQAIFPADRPLNWGEFTVLLEQLRDAGSRADPPFHALNAAARPPAIEWGPLLLANCGPLFPEGPAGTRAPAPGLAAALERVVALRTAGLLAPSFGVDDLPAAQRGFLQGRTALMLSSLAFLRELQGSGLDFVVLPPPTGDHGRPITSGGMGCFAVVDSGDPRRIEAAHRLARFLTSEAAAEAVPGWFLAPPVRGSVHAFYDQPLYAPLRPIMRSVDYMLSPYPAGFIEGSFIPRLQGAVLGQQTPRAAVESILEAAARLPQAP